MMNVTGVFRVLYSPRVQGARVQGGSWGYVSLLAGDERRLFALIKSVYLRFVGGFMKGFVGFCW